MFFVLFIFSLFSKACLVIVFENCVLLSKNMENVFDFFFS